MTIKKILHLTHTDIESDSRILKEIEALATSGYAVSGLGVAISDGSQRSSIEFDANIRAIQLRSRQLSFLPRTLRHVLSLCELMVKMLPLAIRQKPDLVHCHDTLALPLGVFIKLFTRAKLVYDAHELESDRNGLTKLQSKLTLWVEKLFWPFVDRLIVVSPSIQVWYRENIGIKTSSVILNSPLYVKDDSISYDYLRGKFSIPLDRPIFIYVGILGKGRGLDLIAQAFSHPDVTAHVVFLGYGELLDQLQLIAVMHSNFHLHEAVPHAQVVPIVKSADFGLCLVENVSLSDYYCLPNKLFEYCFAGVPVLASDFPDIRTVLEEYDVGECCDLQVDAVRRAINRLGYESSSFHFKDLAPLTWQAQVNKLLSLYSQVLSE